MATDGWDPVQYDRFADQRRQPFWDLLALVAPVPGGRVVDLGCGTGELTALLHQRMRAAETIGLDRSASMLAGSDRWCNKGDGVHFVRGTIEAFPNPSGSDGSFDVIAANASLHWVEDQHGLLQRLRAALRPRGQLAFQVPANFDHPSHTVARTVAKESPFAEILAERPDSGAAAVLAPEQYAMALHRLGFADQHVHLRVYGHVLDSTAAVVEWVKGSLLTPYRERLDPTTYEEFVARYRARLLDTLGDERPYFYPFKRILCWARLP
jgi:trans-aconitate 2-methyltransferase